MSRFVEFISNNNETRWSPIRSVIIRVITKSDYRGVRFVYHDLLSINHKNYNFREKKSQVIKRREILQYKTDNNQNVIDCWLSSGVIG